MRFSAAESALDGDDTADCWSHRNNGSANSGLLLSIPSAPANARTGHRNSAYSASGTALVFDPRRASWQPLRPSVALSYCNLISTEINANTRNLAVSDNARLHVDSTESTNVSCDLAIVQRRISDQPVHPASIAASGPRLSTNAPARIMTVDRMGPQTRNIAPKARIIKNVLILGCTCMFSLGCFYPLRTYLSLSVHLRIVAPLALAIIELSSSLSCFYGAVVARKLTYKMTIVLCQIPFILLLGASVYTNYYTIFPAAIFLGLCRGALWNASVAYLINMAAQFAYFSYETQDKMVKRFLSTFNTLAACGWTWGHLVTAGTLQAWEESQNATKIAWHKSASCGSRFCNRADIAQFPVFRWNAYNGTSEIVPISPLDTKILPVYSTTVYAGNVLCAVVLGLFLLDKLKVQLCSQTSKPMSTRQLFSEITQIFLHGRMRLILPMFIFIGLQEAFIVCDFMKAYVACVAPASSVGYVMLSYGLVNTFLNAFLCAAVRHISRITVLLAGLACHLGALVVMWMWKPMIDDQPILYVISAAWSMSDSIWHTLCQTMVYQSFPEQWEAPFAVFYMGKSLGLAIGFMISPFGCLEYKIYFMALASAAALLPFAIQELQAQKSDWFSSFSPTSSD